MKPYIAFAILLSAFQLFSFSAFGQGSLTPPGPPAPTMKKLDKVEPRTNLQATPAPAGVDTSNADYHFIINQPGSYYLSANIVVTKANGIQINNPLFPGSFNGDITNNTIQNNVGVGVSITTGNFSSTTSSIIHVLNNTFGGNNAGGASGPGRCATRTARGQLRVRHRTRYGGPARSVGERRLAAGSRAGAHAM